MALEYVRQGVMTTAVIGTRTLGSVIERPKIQLKNAHSQHGPARTRTWDQSIMSRLL